MIRPLTAPDERQLWANHARQMQAMEMAESLFNRLHISAALVDAELLFDRQQFCFYVLGNLEPNTTTLAETLREELAADVEFVSLKTAEASQCGSDCGRLRSDAAAAARCRRQARSRRGMRREPVRDLPSIRVCRRGR